MIPLFLGLYLLCLLWLLLSFLEAPEGYEDARGFHYGRPGQGDYFPLRIYPRLPRLCWPSPPWFFNWHGNTLADRKNRAKMILNEIRLITRWRRWRARLGWPERDTLYQTRRRFRPTIIDL